VDSSLLRRAARNRLILLSWLGRICCCILDLRIGDSGERQIEREEKRRNSPIRRKRRRRRKKTTTTTTTTTTGGRLLVFVVSRAEIWHANFKHGIAEGGGGGGDELVVGGEEFGVQWGRRERSRERNNHLWLNTTAVFSNNNRAYYKPHQ